MLPRVQRVPPLPLPVGLFPPLRPGEAVLRSPVRLVVLIITVRVLIGREEDSEREGFVQPGVEEGLQAPPCLGHLRVGLRSGAQR